jgi:hypothetical protein
LKLASDQNHHRAQFLYAFSLIKRVGFAGAPNSFSVRKDQQKRSSTYWHTEDSARRANSWWIQQPIFVFPVRVYRPSFLNSNDRKWHNKVNMRANSVSHAKHDVLQRGRHDDDNSSASSSGRSSLAPVRPNAHPEGRDIWFSFRIAGVFLVCIVLWIITAMSTNLLNRVDKFIVPFCLELLMVFLSWFLFPGFCTDDRVLGVAIFGPVVARAPFAPLIG